MSGRSYSPAAAAFVDLLTHASKSGRASAKAVRRKA